MLRREWEKGRLQEAKFICLSVSSMQWALRPLFCYIAVAVKMHMESKWVSASLSLGIVSSPPHFLSCNPSEISMTLLCLLLVCTNPVGLTPNLTGLHPWSCCSIWGLSWTHLDLALTSQRGFGFIPVTCYLRAEFTHWVSTQRLD